MDTVCHCLALACSDTGDELKFIKDFEPTMMQLWKFLKNSPKRLKIYIKTATACTNYENLSKHKKKHVVTTTKKVVCTRWLSLDAGIDALFKEYVGMTQALRNMKDDRAVAGAQAEGLLGKIDNPTFLGTLHMLKLIMVVSTSQESVHTLKRQFVTCALLKQNNSILIQLC